MMSIRLPPNGSTDAVPWTYYQTYLQRMQKYDNYIRANNKRMADRNWPASCSMDDPVLEIYLNSKYINDKLFAKNKQ